MPSYVLIHTTWRLSVWWPCPSVNFTSRINWMDQRNNEHHNNTHSPYLFLPVFLLYLSPLSPLSVFLSPLSVSFPRSSLFSLTNSPRIRTNNRPWPWSWQSRQKNHYPLSHTLGTSLLAHRHFCPTKLRTSQDHEVCNRVSSLHACQFHAWARNQQYKEQKWNERIRAEKNGRHDGNEKK